MSKFTLPLILALIQPLLGDTATTEATAGSASANVTVNVIVDSDMDGLTDAQEAGLETDPKNPDTDGDGLTDKAEVDAGSDPTINQFTADPDGAGLINLGGGVNLANGLRAVWGFDSLSGGQFLDTSSNTFHGTINGAVTQGSPGSGSVSMAGVFPSPGNYLSISPNVLNGLTDKTKLTFSFWYKQAPVTSSYYRTIFSHQLDNGMAVTIAYAIINGVPKMALVQDYADPANGSSITGVVFIPRVGNDSVITNPTMRLDDNEWHHIIVTVNGNNKAVYVDGDFTTPTQSTTVGFVGTGINTYLAKFSSFNLARGIEGELDQFLIYSRVLNSSELQALWNYDADGDGMSNRDELVNGSNPFVHESDLDRDGLTNAEEVAGQATFSGVLKVFGVTQKDNFDSDGDLFDDYWEAKYFKSGFVDPNDASLPDKDADDDEDGLSNWDEYINGTDPNKAHSDGDGINDKDEVDYGSDPLDAAAKPLNRGDFFGDETLGSFAPIGALDVILKANDEKAPVVRAQVGDESDSHSERWRLRVGSKQVVAQAFGVLSDLTSLSLSPTQFHEVTLEHVATKSGEATDYDYTAIVEATPGSPFLVCDPDELLGPHNAYGVTTDTSWRYKTAYLVPLDNYSWATSYSGNDAVGPRYRKVALNGRPIADEKPEHEEESDLPDEETYVDAFNLGLHHDTTFNYTALGASELVLQASISAEETGFSSRSGLRPHERFDLPFGVGWSSNLCSYIEVVETIGDESDDPVAVNVVDEAGHPQRFGTRNFQTYFPWPSTRVDKKTYLNTLTRSGTTFTLQKKFGSTHTYNKCKTWFIYSTDRVEGSNKLRRHTYWRLAEARDRYGVRLQYDYDSAPGVPNDVSLIPRRISSPDREGQSLVIERSEDSRRIASITDSRNNQTIFNYTLSGSEYAVPGGTAGAWKLTSVSFADGTSTGYSYESAVEEEIDDSDPPITRYTYHYHTNLKSVTDKRGNTHGFNYAFDQSKEYWDSSINGTHCAINPERLPVEVQQYVEEQLALRNTEGHGIWKTMYGMPRRITSVDLPGGLASSTFAPLGHTRFGESVTYTVAPSTTVTDATGNVTVYAFEDMLAEIVDVDATAKSVSKEWMVYYLTSKIHHGGVPGAQGYMGTETYQFDPASGLSLWRATDFSGNVTTWEFADAYGVMPAGLPQGSLTMSKWADPTAKIDALSRSEEYTYNASFRVIDSIGDAFGTSTVFIVDELGRRKFKNVQQGGTVPISQERYDYGNQHFKAFQTGKTTVAFASFSGQGWEADLKTACLPDALGRLWREIVDPNGEKLVTEHTYDSNNNRTATLDARGNRTRFDYDKLNRLIRTTHPSAGTRSGQAVSTKQTWYNENGNKAAEIDEEGHYTIYHYDSLNRRVATIRDMDGQGLPSRNANDLVTEATKGSATGTDLVTCLAYNAVGSVTHQTDPRGIVTRTFHDAIQRPTHVFTGFTVAEAATGDAAGDPLAWYAAQADASTAKTHTEFQYTNASLSLPEGGVVKGNPGGSAFDSSSFKPTVVIRHAAVLTATGTADLHTYAAYDALYRPIRTETEYESGDFAVASTAYGPIAGEKESLQTTTTDARGQLTRSVMDGLQRTVSVTAAFGTALAATTQTIYASTGLVWTTIDPAGRHSETEYDGAARPVKVWQPDPGTGIVNRQTPNDPLQGSPCTRTAYDKNNNVTVTLNPLGCRWEYEYDARNRRIVESQPSVTQTEIVNGMPLEQPFRHPVIRTAFDGVGNVIAVTNARGHITRSFHDNAYRVTDVLTSPVTGAPSENLQALGTNDILIHSELDGNGNVLAVTDGNGNTTRNTYDSLNRLRTTAANPATGQPSADPESPIAGDITVTNAYDDAGNLVQVRDGEGHLTGFRHDGLGRKTRTLWDEGSDVEQEEQSSYDGLVLLTRTDPMNQTTGYIYDDLHRLKDIVYNPAGGTTHPDNRHNTYDPVGNLLTVTYPNETGARPVLRGTGQVFDSLNRLTEETSAGATHIHTYDKAGNRRTTTYAATGRFLSNTYDKLNRLLTCVEKSSSTATVENLTNYAYDLNGNVTRKALPNGSATQCRFDAINRKLTEDTRVANSVLISSFDYSQATAGYPSGYDKSGNLLHSAEQYGHANVKGRSVTNIYDRAGRLATETIAETGGNTTVTGYTYDKANNRTEKTVTGGNNPGTWISTYGDTTDDYNSNQLKSVTCGAIVTSFEYDANGSRRIKQIGGVTTQSYDYDYENRLVAITDTVKGTFTYTCDHRARRVGRDESQADGQNDEISFAGGLSVQEYPSGSDTPDVETIRGSDYGGGIGGILYTIRGSARSYNAYNSRGDVVSKTDDSAAITWQSSYEAFGTRTQEQGATDDRQKANTKDEDAWGCLNEGMRYRDLEFGVFLTRDPAGFVDGPNVYTYVNQDPWTKFDPEGLSAWSDLTGFWKGAGKEAGHMVTGVAKMAWNINPAVNVGQLATGNKTGYQKNFESGMATAKAGYSLATSSQARSEAAAAIGNHLNAAWNDPEKAGGLALNVVVTGVTLGEGGAALLSKVKAGTSLATASARMTEAAAKVEVAAAEGSGLAANNAGKGLGNPFKGKTAPEIDEMFKAKGFEPRGADPLTGKGGYVNPKNQRSYHIDEANSYGEAPHIDVNRLKTYKGPLEKKKYKMGKE